MIPSKSAKFPAFEQPPATRSRQMAAIKSKDTSLEVFVRRTVHHAGFRFRLHPRHVPGKPDFVLPRHRVAVLVNGCFWHGHTCPQGHIPRTNSAYWAAKIAGNIERDARVIKLLEGAGWLPQVIWDCTKTQDTDRLIEMLVTLNLATALATGARRGSFGVVGETAREQITRTKRGQRVVKALEIIA